MAALTDLSDIVARLTDGTAQHPSFYMDNRVQGAAATATGVAQMTSLWRYNKTNGANGAIPTATTVSAPDRTTLGALGQANAGSGKELWLLGLEAVGWSPGVLTLYDRLLHGNTLIGGSSAAQTVGGTITRNTGGEGNEIWLEIHTATGAVATTVSASYTNQAGVSGRTTPPIAFGTNISVAEGRMLRLPLQDGDTGVQSVQTVQSVLSVTSGAYGVVIAKPIARGFLESVGSVMFRDFIGGSPILPKIANDACLAFVWLAAGTTAPKLDVGLHMVEK